MRRIQDTEGQDVTYIPVQLESLMLSEAIPLTVTAEDGDELTGTASPDASLIGRFAGVGGYVDLSIAPLVMPDGESEVEIKIQAGDVAGLKRAALSLSLPESTGAGWLT